MKYDQIQMDLTETYINSWKSEKAIVIIEKVKKSYNNSWKSEKEKKVISTVEQVKKRKLYQQWKSEKKV